jgi:phosphopantothenoylcysteine decarboxylase/phosphopantothenate--cysteine ligase
MAEPEAIFELVERIVRGYRGPLTGQRILVSAGGTREPIDPVRVISNRSSGRQGHAIAEVACRLGAAVTLVTTVDLELALDVVRSVDVVRVATAAQMHDALLERTGESDCVIMAAAVADFTVTSATEKLKKGAGTPQLSFEPTADILHDLVAKRHAGQVIVGFAAETTDVAANALAKLRSKGVDLLVVNDVASPGVGFEHATNEVILLDRDELAETVTLRSKSAVALVILTRVASLLAQGAP